MIISQNVPVSNANCGRGDQANFLLQNQHTCSSYSSCMFSTYRCLSQHNRHCTKRLNTVSISSSQPVTITERAELTKLFSQVTSFVWGEREGTLFIDDSNEIMRKEFSGEKIFLCYPLETKQRYTLKKSLDCWTRGHKIRHWNLLAWEQYTQCLCYYYKTQAKHQNIETIWMPSKKDYSYGKKVKLDLYY